MTKTNHDHYVQQRYLKLFALDKKSTKVNIYDKINNEIRRNQPISKIACENNFYDINFHQYTNYLHTNNIDIDFQVLQFLEKECPKIFDNLFSTQYEPSFEYIYSMIIKLSTNNEGNIVTDFLNNDRIRLNISFYIIFQYLRTEYFRKYLYQHLSNTILKQDIYTEKNIIKLLQNKLMTDYSLISNMVFTINKGIWILGEAPDDCSFCTSDNPVTIITDITKPTSIFSNILQISYPLSPKINLLIMPTNDLDYKKLENQFIPVKRNGVKYFNTQKLFFSNRFTIFSNNDSPFSNSILEKSNILSDIQKMKYFYTMNNL